jgi:hypothetical protein
MKQYIEWQIDLTIVPDQQDDHKGDGWLREPLKRYEDKIGRAHV